MLMAIFPFYKNTNQYDKPANTIIKPLEDELGWDRVKKIFTLEYVYCHKYIHNYNFFTSVVYINFLYFVNYNYSFLFQRKWHVYKRITIYCKYDAIRFYNWLSSGWYECN